MVLSAPGTEGFKSDFAKWQQLTRQATQVLDDVESRWRSGCRRRVEGIGLPRAPTKGSPPNISSQVDSYFKALATRKR